MRLPADYRLLDSETEEQARQAVESEEHWLARYLDPVVHEPLNASKKWVACADENHVNFFEPNQRHTPIAQLERDKKTHKKS